MLHILIRRSGNAIDISHDGKSALSEEAKLILEPQLRYTYFKLLRGQAAYDRAGNRRPIRTELRLLYSYDKYGRMVCGAGFTNRIIRELNKAGYTVNIERIDGEHPRPNRFAEDWDNVLRNFEFRAGQEEALVKIASSERGIIGASVGYGKSYLFSAICLLYPNARIVITTRRKDLVEGTRNLLSKYIPNIGQVGGGQKQINRITVCTADSLHRLNPDDVDLLLADEVHELASPKHSAALAKFRYCRMYGFTATPSGRMDNADVKLESLFGEVIYTMSYAQAVALGLVVPIHVKWIDVRSDVNPAHNLRDVPRSRHGIWRNRVRNQAIADEARQHNDDSQVLIMVTTFDHAVHLRQYLPEFTLCYAERSDDEAFNRFVKSGMLPEDEPIMTSTRRQLLRKQFENGELKKVIATDVWSTGVNFHQLSVIIRADARSSEIMDSQIPGRVCRLSDDTGKQFGLLVDCLDQFDPGFMAAARKRRRNYEAKEWTQELPKCSPLLNKG